MASEEKASAAHAVDRGWLGLALCWFVGVNVRTALLGVPPVLPLIQRDLHLSYTSIGLLSAMPVMCMGLLALPAAALTGRLGARVAVALGLLLVAAGAALRVVPPGAVPLFAFTLVLSIGVTIAQTTVPMLMRQWFPARIGLASALYTNGLIIGETTAVVTTGPVLLHLFGRDAWGATFIAWSVPVVLALALWLWLAPPAPPLGFASGRKPARETSTSPLTRPVEPMARTRAPGVAARRRVSGWHLGFLMGSGSLVYFGMNAWIPSFDVAMGRSASTPIVLAALNAAQLPVSLGLTLVAQRVAGRRWPFIVAGGVVLAGVAGWLWAPTATGPIWVALLGGASAGVYILASALPPMLARRDEVARLTGATLSLGYTLAFTGPLLGGTLLDATNLPAVAFVPVVLAGILLTILGGALPSHDASGATADETDVHAVV